MAAACNRVLTLETLPLPPPSSLLLLRLPIIIELVDLLLRDTSKGAGSLEKDAKQRRCWGGGVVFISLVADTTHCIEHKLS